MLPGSGRDVILSDTVGFISDLPTQLIQAFQVGTGVGGCWVALVGSLAWMETLSLACGGGTRAVEAPSITGV